MRFLVAGALLLVGVACLSAALLHAQDAALPRVGFEESFDSADGWKVTSGAPIKSMVAKDGTVRFETVCGALDARMKRPDWPEWPKAPFPSNTMLGKDYDATVDLDVYRYLVVKLDERGTAVTLFIAGRPTPVCYTTGLRVFDLKPTGFGGKKKMSLGIELLNSSGVGTFDFVRLVRELTEEEKAALMPAPLEYVAEGRSAHPYHGLEALNARAGRPRRADAEGRLAVYCDTLSQGTVWKLTDQPGDQAFRSGDSSRGWGSDGRYFTVTGGTDGKNVWEAAAGSWRETPGGGRLSDKPVPQYAATWESRAHPEVLYGYRTSWRRPECDFIFYRCDRAAGVETEFARFTTDGKWDVRELATGEGDRAVVGLRGTPHVWIIDPEAKAPGGVVRYVKLTARLKGLSLAENDSKLVWFNCYTYEQLQMDLATGKVSLGYYTSGGHAGGGGGWTLRHYHDMTVIQPEDLLDWRAGDKVRIFAYYAKPFDTDYGRLVDGARWWLVNGTSGDVRNQHLLIDGKDCASILRLCGYNSSRNNWATNTYSIASPDATKVAWVSDQLGDGDVHYVVARKPDPPRSVRLAKPKTTVTIGIGISTTKGPAAEVDVSKRPALAWDAPERSLETAGYMVWGAGKDGIFRPMMKERTEKTEWSAEGKTDCTRFLVTAREWSGLESFPSAVVKLDGDKGPDTLHLDAWLGLRSRTARVVFDGTASGTRCVRSFRAAASEVEDATVTWKGVALPEGRTKVFARQRPDRAAGDWTWKELTGGFELGKDSVKVAVPEGVLVDEVIVTGDAGYVPKTIDDRFAVPAGVVGLKGDVAPDGLVTLRLQRPATADFSHAEIFCGGDASFECSNATAVGAVTAAQEPRFLDWGLKPGSVAVYKVVAVSTQGKRSEPVATTVQIPGVARLFTVECDIGKAKPNDKLEKVDRAGEPMLAAKAGPASDKPDPKSFVTLELPFDVPAEGTCSIWARCSPGYTPRLAVPATIDAEAPADWNLRPPYRPMSEMFGNLKGQVKVYTDRVRIGGKDLFNLTAGGHTLTLGLDPSIPGGQLHAIGKIWVTNDPSFRPPGFDPRADFNK